MKYKTVAMIVLWLLAEEACSVPVPWGGAAQSVAVVNPSTISDIVLWFDANNLSRLYQDSAKTTPVAGQGDSVGAWTDSISSLNVLGTAGSLPTYVTNAVNGRSMVRFSGASGVSLKSSATVAITTARTIFAVFKDSGTTNAYGGIYSDAGSASILSNQGSYLWLDAGGGGYVAGTMKPTINSYRVVTAIYTQANTTNSFVYLNGVQQPDCTNHVASTSSGNLQIEIGGRTWGGVSSRVLRGDIGEVIVYNRALTATERINVERYLLGKWGL